MIRDTFEEAFSPKWAEENIHDKADDLVILRKVIPWEAIVALLAPFHDKAAGAMGRSLRVMAALLIVSRLRKLSDRDVVDRVRESRLIQWFCNVPDEGLRTFLHHTSLCKLRKRIGEEGLAIIGEEVFRRFLLAGVVSGRDALIDSTVLRSDIIHPNDVRLIHKAFKKMRSFAKLHGIPVWRDDKGLARLWREFGLDKGGDRLRWLAAFNALLIPALEVFREKVGSLDASSRQRGKARRLLALLDLLEAQTLRKLAGERHIKERIVSLDDPDARPIKKGNIHPDCEFGTTLQMTFNRDGFMVTVESLIGCPNDKTLYPGTIDLYVKRMGGCPETVVTDLGCRSKANLGKNTPDKVSHVFMGRSDDVGEGEQGRCRKARSATEGFIAVAKNLRGFGKSLWHGLKGHRMWSLICQTAFNLKKFLQLWNKDEISEESLVKLGLG